MLEGRNCSTPHPKESICIDTYRVLDSCRDKDCFENVKVFLTGFGEEIIERTSTIRAKCASVISAYIDVVEVPFNKGFYQLNIKIYTKIVFEACVCHGNIQEFEGIAVVEKKVILFGSEGNVNVFKSEIGTGFCEHSCNVNKSSTLPIAVIEIVNPIILGVKVLEPRNCNCCCCCCVEDIPEHIRSNVNGCLSSNEGNTLVVSLGFFSVVKIERPTQILVSATEYNIPEKECIAAREDDPCTLFRSMAFPVNEFSPYVPQGLGCGGYPKKDKDNGGCGCK